MKSFNEYNTDINEMFGIPNNVAGMFMVAVLSQGIANVYLSKNKKYLAKVELDAHIDHDEKNIINLTHLSKTDQPTDVIQDIRRRLGNKVEKIKFEVIHEALSEFRPRFEEDSEYAIKAVVEYNYPDQYGGRTWFSMVPGGTDKQIENKYDFNRVLNKFIEGIQKNGGILIKIHWKGDPVYDEMSRKTASRGTVKMWQAREKKNKKK